jgi:HSP20 family protein
MSDKLSVNKDKRGALKRKEEDPANIFNALQRQVNDIFDDFWGDLGRVHLPSFRTSGRGLSVLSPRLDVSETEDAITVTAELPGVDKKDVDVSVDNDTLTIKGESKQEEEESKKNYYVSERSYGQFERVIPLPVDVNRDKVSAKFKNGVLTVDMPKSEKAKTERKKIDISEE